MTGDDWAAVETIREGAGGDLVLVCEHAAHGIPADLTGLGLSEATRLSHAAWDPGAMDVAQALSEAPAPAAPPGEGLAEKRARETAPETTGAQEPRKMPRAYAGLAMPSGD